MAELKNGHLRRGRGDATDLRLRDVAIKGSDDLVVDTRMPPPAPSSSACTAPDPRQLELQLGGHHG